MTPTPLLRGADHAACAVALTTRLRAHGVAVSASGTADFVAALLEMRPQTRSQLYWAARLTLVDRAEDLHAFDAVFDAVFADAVIGLDPVARHAGAAAGYAPGDRGRTRADAVGDELPWRTRPAVTAPADSRAEDARPIPDVLASRLAVRSDEPFARFDRADVRTIGAWLEHAEAHWPRRKSRRAEVHQRGRTIDLRATTSRSRRTGWDPVLLVRTRPRLRPRPIVFLCDVSGSMQPYATVYLHLMRAAALRRATDRPEVFAFATSLTRLTSVLAHRSAEHALATANERVVDRFGGTRIGRCVTELLASPSGNATRGAVVVVASDGWDSDEPELLRRAMIRLRRRAWAIVWLNPRAGSPGYRPVTGAMAVALPYCDRLLPADSLAGIRDFLQVVADLTDRPGGHETPSA